MAQINLKNYLLLSGAVAPFDEMLLGVPCTAHIVSYRTTPAVPLRPGCLSVP